MTSAQKNNVKKRHPKWRWWGVFCLLLVAVAAWGLTPQEKIEAAPKTLSLQLSPMDVAKVTQQLVGNNVAFTGTLTPWRRVTLSAQFKGEVVEIKVREGDAVKKGQVLARLDKRNITLRYQQSLSLLQAKREKAAQAREKAQRMKKLYAKGYVSETEYHTAKRTQAISEAQAESAEAALKQLQEKRQKAVIKAPFDGWVAKRQADPGEVVAAGAPLLKLVDLHLLELVASVPAAAIPRVDIGQQASFRINGTSDATYHGTVKRINPVAAEYNRRVNVYVQVNNAAGVLRAGMFVRGRILDSAPVSGLAVPNTALQQTPSGWQLYLVDKGRLEVLPVERLLTDASQGISLVKGALHAGDRVVSRPDPSLSDGESIRMVGGS